MVASQTSSGSTSESSRKTRSHATRRESAALRAVTRACLSAARADWVLTLAASGVGIAASSACSDESWDCLSFALPLAERNIADITAVSSTASTTGTSTSHCGLCGRPRRASSFGSRSIARIGPSPRFRGRSELLGLAQLLAELDAVQRVTDLDPDADQPLQLVRDAAEVRGAAGYHDLADAQRSGLVLVELERGDELAREGLQLAPHRLASTIRLFLRQPLRPAAGRE